jgi:hypothetical protein
MKERKKETEPTSGEEGRDGTTLKTGAVRHLSRVLDPPGPVLRNIRVYLADHDGTRSATLNVSTLSEDVPGAIMFARRVARERLGWTESQTYIEKVTLADGIEVSVPPSCVAPPLPSEITRESRRRAMGLAHLAGKSFANALNVL